MKIDHIERPDGRIAIGRGRVLHPTGSPPVTVTEMNILDEDEAINEGLFYALGLVVELQAGDRRCGIYVAAPGDLIVYAGTHDGLPEDDHGE